MSDNDYEVAGPGAPIQDAAQEPTRFTTQSVVPGGDTSDSGGYGRNGSSGGRSSFRPGSSSGGGGRREGGYGGGGGGGGGRDRGGYGARRRVCRFCMNHIDYIDYKDTAQLRGFLSERGKIEPRRKTGACAKHQRGLTTALKRARELALLPYTASHVRFMGR